MRWATRSLETARSMVTRYGMIRDLGPLTSSSSPILDDNRELLAAAPVEETLPGSEH